MKKIACIPSIVAIGIPGILDSCGCLIFVIRNSLRLLRAPSMHVLQMWPIRACRLKCLKKARRQAMSSEINSYKTMSGQAARLGLGEAILGNLEMGLYTLSGWQRWESKIYSGCASNIWFLGVARRLVLGPSRKPLIPIVHQRAFRVQILNAIPFPMERALSTNVTLDCPRCISAV